VLATSMRGWRPENRTAPCRASRRRGMGRSYRIFQLVWRYNGILNAGRIRRARLACLGGLWTRRLSCMRGPSRVGATRFYTNRDLRFWRRGPLRAPRRPAADAG
jgi:hypothetical protein